MNYSYLNDNDNDIISCPEVANCDNSSGIGVFNCDKNQVTQTPCSINDSNLSICTKDITIFYCESPEKSLKFSSCKKEGNLYGYCHKNTPPPPSPGPSPTPPSPGPPSPPSGSNKTNNTVK